MDMESGFQNLVTFRLGRQVYALPIAPIAQIVEMVAITPVPGVNGSVEGVINYHGQSVPAIDLRHHLGLPVGALGVDMHIILARVSERTIGLIVDEVLDVLELPGAQIAHPDDILPQGSSGDSLLRGVAHTAQGTVLLLDPDHLFTPRQPALPRGETRSLVTDVSALPDVNSQESRETSLTKPELEAEV
jgi:purine-binding chemotaxis protein CheW